MRGMFCEAMGEIFKPRSSFGAKACQPLKKHLSEHASMNWTIDERRPQADPTKSPAKEEAGLRAECALLARKLRRGAKRKALHTSRSPGRHGLPVRLSSLPSNLTKRTYPTRQAWTSCAFSGLQVAAGPDIAKKAKDCRMSLRFEKARQNSAEQPWPRA